MPNTTSSSSSPALRRFAGDLARGAGGAASAARGLLSSATTRLSGHRLSATREDVAAVNGNGGAAGECPDEGGASRDGLAPVTPVIRSPPRRSPSRSLGEATAAAARKLRNLVAVVLLRHGGRVEETPDVAVSRGPVRRASGSDWVPDMHIVGREQGSPAAPRRTASHRMSLPTLPSLELPTKICGPGPDDPVSVPQPPAERWASAAGRS